MTNRLTIVGPRGNYLVAKMCFTETSFEDERRIKLA